MAKIFISYTQADKEIVSRLTTELKSRGHEILMDTEVMKVGQDFRRTLTNALKSAEGVIAIISERSLNSKYVISEIGMARAFIGESVNKKFLIPILVGDTEIPNIIEDLYCIRLDENNYNAALSLIEQSISSFYGRKEAIDEKETIERQQIEKNASVYIQDATGRLQARERNNKIIGTTWYIAGFITLIFGIWYAVSGLKNINLLDDTNYWTYVLVILKSIIVIGLLIACSKYAFNLGKSYMHEAMKNADRIHAISFGEFYLKAFGDKINSPSEVKEIFQHWNIDKSSSFLKMDSNSFDPKFNENLIEIIKLLTEKVKGKD